MGKRRDQNPFEKTLPIESFEEFPATFSAKDDQILEARDIVADLLTQADVDAKQRKIVWDDGQRLSITQSAERIRAAYPDLPLELIEDTVIGWLEMEFAPETYSQEQLDELDELTGKWVDAHQAARKN